VSSKTQKISNVLRLSGWLLAFLSVVSVTGCSSEKPASFDRDLRPFLFDAGLNGSELTDGAIQLTPVSAYDSLLGYGWTDVPEKGFIRHDLDRSRGSFTLDGVSSQQLAFRADLHPGDWWLTLWVEAGMEDATTLTLTCNDRAQDLGWHPFLPPAEPRTRIQKAFRLFQGVYAVTKEGLQFSVTGGKDSVRVLGFSLNPDSFPSTDDHLDLYRQTERAGRYGKNLALDELTVSESRDLDDLLVVLDSLRTDDPFDVFAAYWYQQVDLLARAEQHLRHMGWEWATEQTGLGIFDRFHQAVMILDALLKDRDRDTFPLYDRALFQRGRLLHWLALERGGPNETDGARRDLAELLNQFPLDTLLAMYNGSKIDLLDACDRLPRTPGAPMWSTLQREALCRLRAEVHWWVNERQAANGELGGKIDDDVELLRWWPILLLSGDTLALKGWQRLADAAWNSDGVYQGYSRSPRDVEHAAEFIADTAPELVVFNEKQVYLDRLRFSGRYFSDLWTGLTPSGRRLFRSAWFSSTEIDTRPPRNRDVEMNTRATKAVRYLAWKTRDPDIIRVLHEWSTAWAETAGRTDKAKPAGILPPSIRFPDGAINGEEPTWYDANMYWDYYDWEHNTGSMMLDQLLFTFTLTGDVSLLDPITSSLDLIRTQQTAPPDTTAGSLAWAAGRLRENRDYWNVVEQWRYLTGDTRYDDLLQRYGSDYARFRLTGDETKLEEGLTVLLDGIRYNTPLRTTEVLHTDRVRTRNASHLKAMLSGYGASESPSPFYAVSWSGTDKTFTALVAETSPERLVTRIFSHAPEECTITMRMWQLEPGSYQMRNSVTETTREITLSANGQTIPITVPPQTLLTLEFDPL